MTNTSSYFENKLKRYIKRIDISGKANNYIDIIQTYCQMLLGLLIVTSEHRHSEFFPGSALQSWNKIVHVCKF